jgi:hypothetical protein
MGEAVSEVQLNSQQMDLILEVGWANSARGEEIVQRLDKLIELSTPRALVTKDGVNWTEALPPPDWEGIAETRKGRIEQLEHDLRNAQFAAEALVVVRQTILGRAVDRVKVAWSTGATIDWDQLERTIRGEES